MLLDFLCRRMLAAEHSRQREDAKVDDGIQQFLQRQTIAHQHPGDDKPENGVDERRHALQSARALTEIMRKRGPPPRSWLRSLQLRGLGRRPASMRAAENSSGLCDDSAPR